MTALDGRVALVTGGARGNGRAIARAFAQAGAAVVVTDIARTIDGVPYEGASQSDLDRTRQLIEQAGGQCLTVTGDVRVFEDMRSAVSHAVQSFGRLDFVVPNAGIFSGGVPAHELSEQQWDDMLAVNTTGAWNTARAAIPTLMDQGEGAITFISSMAGLIGLGGFAHYVTAKHAVIGLMRALAVELGPFNVRSNAVCPTVVDTPMTQNQFYINLFGGGGQATRAQMEEATRSLHLLPRAMVEPDDVANATVWLSSAQGGVITGVALPVDLGGTNC